MSSSVGIEAAPASSGTHVPMSASRHPSARAPSALPKGITRTVLHRAARLSMKRVSGAYERGRHIVPGNDRAIVDRIPKALAVNEGVELPLAAQRPRISYFYERV